MDHSYFDGTDAELAGGGAHFVTVVTTSSLSTYGLLTADLTSYTAANTAFQAAYAATQNPMTRTSSAIRGRVDARRALVACARATALKINGTPTVTAQMKMDLGIKPRSSRSPIPAPTDKPVGEVVEVDGNRVTFRAHQADSTRRGKPAGVYGMMVYSYVGENCPNDVNLLKAEGNATQTKVVVEFPQTLAPFTKVWISCCWISPRLLAGPGSVPIATNLGTDAVQSVAPTGELKLAA